MTKPTDTPSPALSAEQFWRTWAKDDPNYENMKADWPYRFAEAYAAATRVRLEAEIERLREQLSAWEFGRRH